MHKNLYPNLLKPIKIRDLLVKNRIMSAPNMLFRTIGGRPDEYYLKYLEHKARGGAGIVNLGEANVCDGGNHTPGMETTLENLTIYSEIAHAIHQHGAVASVELTHGGMRVKPQFNKDLSLIMGPCELDNPLTGAHVRAMTVSDMEYVANGFAETAEYYFHAGFDTVLLHCAHSWLLTQFLSPIVNKRTDEYGGSLENRMRFPLYVLKTVRERVGEKKPLMIRLSGSERLAGGFTTEDIIEFLSKAQSYVDLAEISTEDFRYIFATSLMERGQNLPLAAKIKQSGRINIPVYTIGSILEPDQAEEIIASGAADGVSMSRALIADPFLPRKAATGRVDDVTPCLRCLNCTGSDNDDRHFICSVNPLIAREARLGFGDSIAPACNKKAVLVVGGGPAGMQAAITASQRGHRVTLAERGGALGGTLRFTETDCVKHDLRRFTEYLIRKTNRSGVNILLNTEVTDDKIEKLNPDHIIVATGSLPVTPAIPGIDKARHAQDVYLDAGFDSGDSVVIIGGGLVGVESGLHLANLGKKVTVLEIMDDYARDARALYRMGLDGAIGESSVKVITSAQTLEIADADTDTDTDTGTDTDTAGQSGSAGQNSEAVHSSEAVHGSDTLHGSGAGLVVTYKKGGETVTIFADTVLYAVGMQPNEELYFELYDKAPLVRLIGDAKSPGKVDGAIHSGYFAAMDV